MNATNVNERRKLRYMYGQQHDKEVIEYSRVVKFYYSWQGDGNE